MRTDQIAIQTITVRAEAERDMLLALRRLAGLGYRNVEFAGTGSATPEQTRRELDLLGLRTVAVQIGFPGADTLQQLVDYAQLLGAGYAVITWVPEEFRPNAAAAGRLAELFNRLGEQCRDAGIGCAYHNHDFEFAAHSDGCFFDVLTAALDPQLVKLEIDVYWAALAGQDPVGLLRQHSGRVPLLHLKDMAPSPGREMAAIGDGIMPWPEILTAAQSAGTEWYIVEHDDPADPMQVAEQSLRYLERLAE